MLKLHRINNEAVKPVHFHDVVLDKRPVAGADIFPEIYANIFICAKKKSGKTCAIAHIIEQCATTETKVIAFVSTLNRDATWRAIEKRCKDRNIDFTGFTSIHEGKEDILQAITTSLNHKIEGKEEPSEITQRGMGIVLNDDDEPRNKKKKIPKHQAPEIIFIFDDLSAELKSPSITDLVKQNRHYKCKVILSSQYWNDMDIKARLQMQYVMLYKGLSKQVNKLEDIYKNCSLSIEFELFVHLYRECSREQYHFMYIDTAQSTFRKDFTHAIVIPKELEE